MTYFLKDCAKKVLKIKNWIVIENFKPVPRSPIKWRPLKLFTKLHKGPLLIASIVKGTVACRRQFLATKTLGKMILTNQISYWQIKFCLYCASWLNQMSDIREVWKYWLLKDGFCTISQKFYRATILWWVNQKTSKF